MLKFKFGSALTALAVVFWAFTAPANATEITWYGQAAFKIVSPGGKVIVIDPFIMKNPKTPKALKDLKKVGKVDVILVTTVMVITLATPLP